MVDIGREQAGVHAPEVLHEVDEAVPGLNPQNKGALAQLEIEVEQQGLGLGGSTDQDGEIAGQRGTPCATLGAKKRKNFARLALLFAVGLAKLVGRANSRRPQIFGTDGLRQVIRDPNPHSLEQLIARQNRAGGYEQLCRVQLQKILSQLQPELLTLL